jgi:hypothetical protein
MEITDLQFAAAQEYRADVQERFAKSDPTTIIQTKFGYFFLPNRMNFMFKGFQMDDGKLFVGTGAFKSMGEDVCIQYSNWKLFDMDGVEVEDFAMSAEELNWHNSKKLVGPESGGFGIDV